MGGGGQGEERTHASNMQTHWTAASSPPRVKMSNKFIPAAPHLRLSLPERDSNRLRVDDFVVYFPGRSQFVILTGGWGGSRLMTWTAAPQRLRARQERRAEHTFVQCNADICTCAGSCSVIKSAV